MLQVLLLLGDAAGFDGSDIAPALSMIGSLGISIWYVYHTTTHSIPKMLADHQAERDRMQERFDKQCDDTRADFNKAVDSLIAEMKEQRAQFGEWMRSHQRPRA